MEIFPEGIFSKEILCIIRDYVISLKFPQLNMYDYQIFQWYDNHKSWRTFLSTHKSVHWSKMRKELIFLNLNRFYSVQFVRDGNIRLNVLSRILDAKSQLFLRLTDTAVNEFEFGIANTLGLFGLYANYGIVSSSLVSSSGFFAKQLIFQHSNSPDESVQNIGNQALFQEGVEEIYDIWYKFISSSLPLQSLMRLEVSVDISLNGLSMTQLQFPNLEYLKLYPKVTWFPEIPNISLIAIPSLKSLDLSTCTVDDISGCVALEELSLFNASILDGLHLLLQLRKIACSSEDLIRWQCDLTKLSKLQELSLQRPTKEMINSILNFTELKELHLKVFPEQMEEPILWIPSKIRVLVLSKWSGSLQWQHSHQVPNLDEVRLLFINLSDYSFLQNTRQVTITNCSINDCSALTKIPYLFIHGCENIQDFTCLGKYQRYLKISKCFGLKNEHLSFFSNVFYLNLSENIQLTKIQSLIGITYFIVRNCLNLQEIILEDKNNHEISILSLFGCSLLTTMECIHPKEIHIGQLDIRGTRLDTSMIVGKAAEIHYLITDDTPFRFHSQEDLGVY